MPPKRKASQSLSRRIIITPPESETSSQPESPQTPVNEPVVYGMPVSTLPTKKKIQRKPWTDEETDRLKEAFAVHNGKWSAMASAPNFKFNQLDSTGRPSRTASDLKDRWRTVKRQTRVKMPPFPAKYIENEAVKTDIRGTQCTHYLVVPSLEYMASQWIPSWALERLPFFNDMLNDYMHFKKCGCHLDGNRSREEARLKVLLSPVVKKPRITRRSRLVAENQEKAANEQQEKEEEIALLSSQTNQPNLSDSETSLHDAEITTLQATIKRSAIRHPSTFNKKPQSEIDLEQLLDAAAATKTSSTPNAIRSSINKTPTTLTPNQQQRQIPITPSSSTAKVTKKHSVFPVDKTNGHLMTPTTSPRGDAMRSYSSPSPIVESRDFRLIATTVDRGHYKEMHAELRRSADDWGLAKTTVFKINVGLIEEQGGNLKSLLEDIPVLKDGVFQIYTSHGNLRPFFRENTTTLTGSINQYNQRWAIFDRINVNEECKMPHSILKTALVHSCIRAFAQHTRGALISAVSKKDFEDSYKPIGFKDYQLNSCVLSMYDENMQSRLPALDYLIPNSIVRIVKTST